MRRIITAAQIAALSSLIACSDPKAATDANFRKALGPVVADAFCRPLSLERMVTDSNDDAPPWPLRIPKKPSEPEFAGAEQRGLLDAAVGEGMLEKREATIPARRRNYPVPLKPTAVITYTVTKRGEPYFRSVMDRTPSGMRPFPAACAAAGEVVDVVRFTDPADAFGRTVSQVTYRYRGTQPIGALPSEARAEMETPKEATVVMVRSSDGWQPVEP